MWAELAVLDNSVLQPGQAAWVSLDVSRILKQLAVRIDWELTWNPFSVPVLPRFLRTERAAGLVVQPWTAFTEGVVARGSGMTPALPAHAD